LIQSLYNSGWEPERIASTVKLKVKTVREVLGIEKPKKMVHTAGYYAGFDFLPDEAKRFLQLRACVKVALEAGVRQLADVNFNKENYLILLNCLSNLYIGGGDAKRAERE